MPPRYFAQAAGQAKLNFPNAAGAIAPSDHPRTKSVTRTGSKPASGAAISRGGGSSPPIRERRHAHPVFAARKRVRPNRQRANDSSSFLLISERHAARVLLWLFRLFLSRLRLGLKRALKGEDAGKEHLRCHKSRHVPGLPPQSRRATALEPVT